MSSVTETSTSALGKQGEMQTPVVVEDNCLQVWLGKRVRKEDAGLPGRNRDPKTAKGQRYTGMASRARSRDNLSTRSPG